MRSFCIIFFLALNFFICINKVKANTDNELTGWGFIDINIPLERIRHGLSLRESFSHRFNNEFSELDISLFRSELASDWNKNLQTSLGYDHFRIYHRDANYENRLWQQILLRKKLSKNELYSRFRIEERFTEASPLVLRLRNRSGYIYYLSKSLSLDLSNEIFLNLVNSEGIDQNRVMLLVRKDINKHLSIIGGYQIQHFFLDKNLINHGLITRLQISL